MAKKKILLKPISELGLDRKAPICYNCVFWWKNTGYCPMYNEYYNYNHKCKTRKIFRYDFSLPYENIHI